MSNLFPSPMPRSFYFSQYTFDYKNKWLLVFLLCKSRSIYVNNKPIRMEIKVYQQTYPVFFFNKKSMVWSIYLYLKGTTPPLYDILFPHFIQVYIPPTVCANKAILNQGLIKAKLTKPIQVCIHHSIV